MLHPHPHSQAMATMEISGTLARDAELRNRVLDRAGHTVPVICLDLLTTGGAPLPVHVEWPQPADGHQAAALLIQTLKRGTTVTVQAPVLDMRLVAANASQVHASALPTPTPALSPELSPVLF
jgi:hypothetical protein